MACSRSSPRTRRAAATALAAACALVLLPASAGAATIDSGTAGHADLSPPLRTLEPRGSAVSGAHPARAFGRTLDELRLEPHDRGRQAVDAPGAAPVPGSQWDGISNVNGVIPPDTNGDVGPRDYVQWVNLSLKIWSKSGASRYGPVPGNTLFQGFGGVCETTNQGDPVVTYDRAADRWVLMQFAFATKGGHEAPPYRVCVAVSQTGDPTGAYHRSEFGVTGASSYFPDYPKLGVWNDAYYLTTNNFNGNLFAGAGIYALDRTKMLAGDPTAGFVGQQLPATYGGLLPAHRDGPTPPPAGAPGYFAGIDTEGAGTGSTVQVWRIQPNFATPAATTVTGPANIAVNPHRFSFGCSANPDCIPQPGTTQTLDALSDRLMHRLEYRNFGDHESLLLTHTVNVASGSASQAGERWYELRDVATAPAVHQQGTYAPADGVSRWMGSAAMDGYGDIALGYSASGSSLSPSIRYTGRLGGDPLGSMTLGEQTLLAGGGSQTGYPRWGDYSSMSIDPVDDATFWYTQEYYSRTSAAGWRTRISSFKLVPTPNVSLAAPTDGAVATGAPLFSGTATGGTGDVSVAVHSGGSTSGALVQTRTA